MRILVVFISFFFLLQCSSKQIAENAVTLDVSFKWRMKHGCSNKSPKITIKNAPKETERFIIRLKDLDVLSFHHGGGVVKNNGSGIIPEGALKSNYKGPCPPSGQHNYRFTVDAVDKNGVIIGRGQGMQPYPPK